MLLDEPDESLRFTTFHIPYYEGAHMIGKYIDIDGVEHEIDTALKTTNDVSNDYNQNCF